MSTNPETPFQTREVPEPKKEKKRSPLWFKLGGVLIVILLFAIAAPTAIVYYKAPTDPLVRSIASVFPYPAIQVNGETITISDYLAEYDALQQYFSELQDGEIAPLGAELESGLADTLVNKLALRQMAALNGVDIDEGEVDRILSDIMLAPGGDKDFEAQIQENFGWTIDEFRLRVVESVVLASQMSEFIDGSAELQQERRAAAEAALVRLETGESFELVASEVSEDFSAKAGGNIGFVKASEMPAAWLSALESKEVDELTGIIEMPEVYFILKVTDRILQGEDEEIQLSAIVISKRTLEEVVDAFIAESEVKNYLTRKEA